MKAHAERMADDLEARYFQAWSTERFAREKKLYAFSRYANDLKPKRSVTPRELLAMFRSERKRGGGITIKRRKRNVR